MRTYTQEELKVMSLEDAVTAISVAVYQATALMEDLEHAGRVYGNGHHARQKIAIEAAKELQSRWKE